MLDLSFRLRFTDWRSSLIFYGFLWKLFVKYYVLIIDYIYTVAVRGWREICHTVPLASKCELFLFVHQFLHKGNKNLVDCSSYKCIIAEVENSFARSGNVVYILNKTIWALLDGSRNSQWEKKHGCSLWF